jgi:hypothetical protein
MNIITNRRSYDLHALHELPAKVQQDFDYVREAGDYSPRFVKYRGTWYDIQDSQIIRVSGKHDLPMGWAWYVEPDHPLAEWHGIVSETFFSGVLFKLLPDNRVVCGRYFS